MTDSLTLAQQQLLQPGGLAEADLERLLGTLLAPSVDAADLYFQFTRHESWVLEDGIVKNGHHSIEQGAGARAMAGEKTGFAYSDELLLPALTAASQAARAIARSGSDGSTQAWRRASAPALYTPADPIESVPSDDKIRWLKKADEVARAVDPRVEQVIVSIAASHDVILVAASDGTLAGDVRPLVRFNVQVIAADGQRRENGMFGCGGRYGIAELLTADRVEHAAQEAVRQALVNLDAVDAPAGTMTVVLGPGWPGVLLHEAVGHGLEGDFNRKGTSAFSGRMGEQVASELCTVVDDGTLASRRGSLTIDDEGVPSQCTTLIENGRLTGYMQDKLNARLVGTGSTGNGRRESFAHLPMPRMTNTYMRAGDSDPEEIIRSVDKGLYAVNFGGGQVDITSGQFVFSASEAYLIENGKVTAPVKGATLIGNGPEAMTRVSMVGNDLELDAGVGVCGKNGQSVPVGVGQPTLRIDELTVGGTQA
ncbi:MAG: metalloprotease TldD [Pseudomonadota bacterium]